VNTNEFLASTLETKEYKKEGPRFQVVRPFAIMADGFTVSIQASKTHYCEPRENEVKFYSKVELGYPSAPDELILEYAEDQINPTSTIYGYVPVSIVDKLIEKHGGIVKVGRYTGHTLITQDVTP
jgi:hypothetical protein